ncbi:SGNH/GDSL hydrolase family protein [Frankia sp. AgKG'84/4]
MPFALAAQEDRATVLTRTLGGTAICDWFDEMERQLKDWAPTIAVLSFSGNSMTPCMHDREPLAAYEKDAAHAISLFSGAGVTVDLVESPTRREEPVDGQGRTALTQLWTRLAAGQSHVHVLPAGRALTDSGRWTSTMSCRRSESCDSRGLVTVRNPDGVHLCPVAHTSSRDCPVYSPGAERYGRSMAGEALGRYPM